MQWDVIKRFSKNRICGFKYHVDIIVNIYYVLYILYGRVWLKRDKNGKAFAMVQVRNDGSLFYVFVSVKELCHRMPSYNEEANSKTAVKVFYFWI